MVMNQPQRKAGYQIADTRFEVIYADITGLITDAIVSSDDTYLSMGGGVSLALRMKGGPSIQEEIKKHIPLQLGEVAVTSAGALPAKYIFHGVTTDYEQWEFASAPILRSIVRRALQLSDTLGVKTIAFPALGTGVADFPFQMAAQVMTDTISDYLMKGRTKIELVTLCLYARPGMEEEELNRFFEQAVGIASVKAQSTKLDNLLEEVKATLTQLGKNSFIEEIDTLRAKIAEAGQQFSTSKPDSDAPEATAELQALTAGIAALPTKEEEAFNDRQLQLQLLRTKLSGLYTTLNIKESHLNKYRIEEAKYGGVMVPPRLSFAIADLEEEIKALETEVQEIRREQVRLTT